MNFDSKNGRKRSFSYETKHKYHLYQREECVYGAQSWKDTRLLCESIFIPIERETSILKLVEKQASLVKPKHQNHLPQQGECDYGAQSRKERR